MKEISSKICAIVGFSLFRTWGYITFFSSGILFDKSAGSRLHSAYIISLLALGATMVASGVVAERITPTQKSLLRIAGPIITAVGTLLLAFIDPLTTPGVTTALTGGVLTGIGSGIMSAGWGSFFGSLGGKGTALYATVSFVIAGLLYSAFTTIPTSIDFLIVVLAPLLSGFLLFGKLEVWSKLPLLKPLKIDSPSFFYKFGIGITVFCVAIGLGQSMYLSRIDLIYEGQPLGFLIASCIAALVIMGTMRVSKNFNFGLLYRPILLFITIGFLTLPLFRSGIAIPSLIVNVGYLGFQLMLWIIFADLTHRLRFDSIVIFGFGIGTFAGGVALGAIVDGALLQLLTFNAWTVNLITVIVVGMMIVTYSYILTERDIWEMSADRSSQTYNNGPLKNRCDEISRKYSLGDREAEVFYLFAKGRSATRIQEELFMSSGTVNTHLGRIYRKLGVHTRQDLLDLIEGADSRN